MFAQAKVKTKRRSKTPKKMKSPEKNSDYKSPTKSEATPNSPDNNRRHVHQSPDNDNQRDRSKSPSRKPKMHSKEIEELRRNWKSAAMK
jgi:hypothetical protein